MTAPRGMGVLDGVQRQSDGLLGPGLGPDG